MKDIFLTISLILFTNTVAATSLSIKHNKKLPTPYELITKGELLNKTGIKQGQMAYFIAWDKTDDIYWCVLDGRDPADANCYLAKQRTPHSNVNLLQLCMFIFNH